jgi:hypothetical protein
MEYIRRQTANQPYRYDIYRFPYFSELERDVGMGAGSLVLIVAGRVLVFLMVRPTKN